MNTLYIIALLGILLISLYNAIVYSKRRRSDKQTTKSAIETLVYHRELTQQERKLLDELQEQKEFKKTHRRIDNKVYLLKGDFKRHGIEVRHETTWHNLIGGLEVTLDDRGLDYLKQDNIVEVIKTNKHPVAITLNDEFSLLAHLETEQQMEKGSLGKIAGSDVELMRNREQSSQELQALEKIWKVSMGSLLMMVALLLIALTLLWDVSAAWGLIPGAVLFLISLYLIWRKPKYSKPLPVRTLRGVPSYRAVVDEFKNVQAVKVFMGNVELRLEENWLPFMIQSGDDETPVEIDVTTDGSVMRFGPYLSLHEQEEKYPSKSWYRHMIVAFVAAAAAIATLITAPTLTSSSHFMTDISDPVLYNLYFYAPAIFMVLNLILIAVHAPLGIKGRRYSKKRDVSIREFYSNQGLKYQ